MAEAPGSSYAFASDGPAGQKGDGSDLNDFRPLWERELPHALHQPPLERLIRREMHVPQTARGENLVGNPRPLAQDVFNALVVRQRGVAGSV